MSRKEMVVEFVAKFRKEFGVSPIVVFLNDTKNTEVGAMNMMPDMISDILQRASKDMKNNNFDLDIKQARNV